MEEHLIAAFRPLGPVLAVGSPRDQLPPVGARRLYLPGGDWKPPVRSLMVRARMVVIALDATPGTVWEFVEATRVLPPQRLILAVPADKEKYDDFRSRALIALTERAHLVSRTSGKRWSPPILPEYRAPARSNIPLREDVISGLILFSPDWSATFEPLRFTIPLFDVGHVRISQVALPAFDRLAAFEAGEPASREAQVTADRISSIRRMFVMFALGVVFVGLIRMSPANNWGLPQTSSEWWMLALSALVGVGMFWGLRLMERKARLLAVPRPRPRVKTD
ncbi:hypothetical protein [Actinophytocola algeriensis]|uniref:Uncharacterized protein n=1 Tax=Actinophytocola algeriensis TaxID=1768010 RepID=A0A7W7Q3T1_9PSEU|nr:hypothetical protein [Actinophytocola algeriensis]MBB4906266.1 hypothetical protein [Actinophytocola algeriensis]MBE1472049.1 hypothetical protein [Actinophytocola algeriensis]